MLCEGLWHNICKFFLLALHFFDQFTFLKASTSLYSHPAKPRAERAVSKFWWTSFESRKKSLTWLDTMLSSPVCCSWSKGKLQREMSGNALCPIALRSSCHTPRKGTVIHEEWFNILIFIGPSAAEYNPSLIMDFTARVYLYHFGRLQWLLHFHFIMMNYLKSFLSEQIPPASTPARMFHFVLKIAIGNFPEPLICQTGVYYHSQSRHTGAVWKVL